MHTLVRVAPCVQLPEGDAKAVHITCLADAPMQQCLWCHVAAINDTEQDQ